MTNNNISSTSLGMSHVVRDPQGKYLTGENGNVNQFTSAYAAETEAKKRGNGYRACIRCVIFTRTAQGYGYTSIV
jgi:hypothetical protein